MRKFPVDEFKPVLREYTLATYRCFICISVQFTIHSYAVCGNLVVGEGLGEIDGRKNPTFPLFAFILHCTIHSSMALSKVFTLLAATTLLIREGSGRVKVTSCANVNVNRVARVSNQRLVCMFKYTIEFVDRERH